MHPKQGSFPWIYCLDVFMCQETTVLKICKFLENTIVCFNLKNTVLGEREATGSAGKYLEIKPIRHDGITCEMYVG